MIIKLGAEEINLQLSNIPLSSKTVRNKAYKS